MTVRALCLSVSILLLLATPSLRSQDEPAASSKATFEHVVAEFPKYQGTSPFDGALRPWLDTVQARMRDVIDDPKWTLPIDTDALSGLAGIRRRAVRTRGTTFSQPHFGGGAVEIEGVVRISHLMAASVRGASARIAHVRKSVVRGTNVVEHATVHDSIVIAGAAEISHALRSLIIVDGNAAIAHATDCVIVARGAVRLASATRTVVMSGAAITASHANPSTTMKEQPQKEETRSHALLATGGFLQVSHGFRSVLTAAMPCRIAHATDTTFLNCERAGEPAGTTHDSGCRTARHPFPSLRLPRPDGLPRLELVAVRQANADAIPHAVRLRVDDAEHEVWLRPDRAVIASGPLRDWRLTFTAPSFAVLTKDRRDLLVMAKTDDAK